MPESSPPPSRSDGVYRGHPARGGWLPGAVLGTVAVLAVIFVQVVGLFALLTIGNRSNLPDNRGFGKSCYAIHLAGKVPPDVIRDRAEHMQVGQSWSWAPPGVVCQVEVSGHMVPVHRPSWDSTRWPDAIFGVSLAGGSAVIVAAVRRFRPARWSRFRTAVAAASTVVLQPLVLPTLFATVLVITILPTFLD